MKYFVTLLILTRFCHFQSQKTQEEIDYYYNLIAETVLELEDYTLPTYYDGYELEDEEAEPLDFGTFDFIIVGAGPGGTVLARRLSEIKEFKILLVEGGPLKGNNFTDIPFMYEYLLNSAYNWGFSTARQTSACGASNNICTYPRGKGLGGSTLINGNIFAHGVKSDFDNWATEMGLETWSYEKVLPYFKKFENATALVDIDKKYHGFRGPMVVESYKDIDPVGESFFEAAKENGLRITDYNGIDAVGVGLLQKSTIRGRRNSVAKAFLEPVEYRKNLVVQVGSLVTKVLFEDGNATGIYFHHEGRKYVAYANKEIILSAGVIGSPQILLLSGVGPSHDLTQLNISIIKDLPVGKMFRDHVYMLGSHFFATTNYSFYLDIRTAISDYLESSGFLTRCATVDLLGFFEYKGNTIEIAYGNTASIDVVNGSTIILGNGSTEVVNIIPGLMHPSSVGSLTLASSNPLDFPIIDPNLLAEEKDVETLIDGLEFISQIIDSKAFRSFNVTLSQNDICSNYTFKSRDYFRCLLRYGSSPGLHGVSTCTMGKNETNSIVNERLTVHGLGKLRVVDASVIPSTITGHTFGTVCMVAEKAADMIKEDHGVL